MCDRNKSGPMEGYIVYILRSCSLKKQHGLLENVIDISVCIL